jgi:hypothetical protein
MKLEAAHRLLAAAVKWVMPKPADLALEYKYEYLLPSRHWDKRCKAIGAHYPLFDSEDDFIAKIRAASIEPITPQSKVENVTDLETIEDVEDLVSTYQRPRDVSSIVNGYRKGGSMPMPIIIRGKKGSWILSGNTRTNLAFILKIPVKAIWVDG